VDTYEVGYRQALLGHKVEFTTSIFYNDYNGVQVSAHANAQYADNIVLAIVNGGSARTYGAEETLNWRVINPLTLGVDRLLDSALHFTSDENRRYISAASIDTALARAFLVVVTNRRHSGAVPLKRMRSRIVKRRRTWLKTNLSLRVPI